MRKSRLFGWGLAGVLALTLAVHAGKAPDDAKYIGSGRCKMCHGNRNKDITTRFFESTMCNAMKDVAEDAAAIKADFAGAPFKREQVAYTLSSGKYQQAYLDKDFKVLPAKWIVADKKWVPTPAVDGAKECVGCHMTNYDVKAGTFKALGVGCESCHGPGSAHMKAGGDDKKQVITDPKDLMATLEGKQASAMICGQCHSRGRSTDGTTAFPQGYRPQDDLNKSFKHDEVKGAAQNQQLNELMGSKHWKRGVVCATCHDPHGETGNPFQLRKPITDMCLTCHARRIVDIPTHTADKKVTAPAGATCATCHMPEGQHLFTKEAVKVPK